MPESRLTDDDHRQRLHETEQPATIADNIETALAGHLTWRI